GETCLTFETLGTWDRPAYASRDHSGRVAEDITPSLEESSVGNWLSRLTMAWVSMPPAVRGTPGVPAEVPVPIFANAKALTFPGIVGLVKGGWEGLQFLPYPWVKSLWFPLAACFVLGMTITVSDLSESKQGLKGWVLGLCVGALNCLVVFGAVMAVP